MKKIFTKLMLWAVAAAALVSCENNLNEESAPIVENLQTVTLSAEKPTEVRTEMIEGVPYWSKGDQIGVYVVDGESYKNYAFKNDNEEATLTTSFTGQTAVANTLFVYYPYTNFGTPVTEKGVKVEILANQEPTATSFDGRSDLMIAKPVQLDAEGKQLSNLEFARVAAIVKIVLKDKTGNLAGQHVSSLTMTAATNLVGRVYLDVVNQEIFVDNEGVGLYYGGAPSVNATYTEATQYEVNGTNATYVIVYPQTLAAGSKLSFEAVTEGYAISKEITLGQDIVLEPGKVTTLNVSLAAENVVKEEAGLALPFEDDFARYAIDNNETALTSIGENYSAIEKIYKSKDIDGAIKFGTSSVAGSITTVSLNLSQPFTVILAAKNYGTDNTKVNVTVAGVTKSVTLTSNLAYYAVEFDAASKKEAVTVASSTNSKQRFHLDDLQVVAGHDVVLPTLPPVLTVSQSEISVSHKAATETFTYSIANPVDGTNVGISDNADWISTSANGTTVNVTIAENTAEEAREGIITVTYGDLTKTVTVKQAAKPAEGGDAQTAQYVKVTSTSDITSGTYLIVYESKSYVFNGGLATASIDAAGNYKTVTITNNTIESNATTDAMAFVYDASKKSFKGVGGAYIGRTSNSNGMDEHATTVRTHTSVTISNGNAIITSSGGPNLQFYDSGSNSRFRYYSTTQKAIQLYKLVGGESGSETPETPATPVLSVNPTTLSFDAAAGSKTIACTIENEVSGQNVTATESVDWLSTSVSGKTVTVTATANTGAARTATVTIAYTGAESKTVTVSQAAAEQGGGDEGGTATPKTVTFTFKNYTKEGTTATEGDVTFTGSKGTASTSTRFWTDGLRTYAGSAMKFAVPAGMVITKIDFSNGVSDWTGSQQVVEFTGLAKLTITSATVTYQ